MQIVTDHQEVELITVHAGGLFKTSEGDFFIRGYYEGEAYKETSIRCMNVINGGIRAFEPNISVTSYPDAYIVIP